MTARPALLGFTLLLLLLPAPALAQLAPATGSLTIMSRPSGAWFRLVGDQIVVGRTPVTLDRGMIGHYRVSGGEIGYERWNHGVTLDGVTSDTLWMALKTKGALMAGARSLIVPGWGQFYDNQVERGTVYILSALAAGAAIGVTQVRYQDRLDDYRTFDAAYQAASTPAQIADAFNARQAASRRVDDAWKQRRYAIGAAIAVWSLSFLDAMVSVPRPAGPVLLGSVEAVPSSSLSSERPRGLALAMTVARVRF